MNLMNSSPLFPNAALALSATAGWPVTPCGRPLGFASPSTPVFMPLYPMPCPVPPWTPAGAAPAFFWEPTFPSAPGAPGPLQPPAAAAPLGPEAPVPLPAGAGPSPSARSSPGTWVVVLPAPQNYPAPSPAPAPGSLGLPPVAPAAGYLPIGSPVPVGPIPARWQPQPVPAFAPVMGNPTPTPPPPAPLGQRGPASPTPGPLPVAMPLIAYVTQPLPTPPGAAPVYGPPIPVFALPPFPVPAPDLSAVMPPPPPPPPPIFEGTGRGEAAPILSPQYANGVAGLQSSGRPVRGGGAASSAAEPRVGIRPLGIGPDAEPAGGPGPDPQGRALPDGGAPGGGPGPGRLPRQRPATRKPLLNGHK